MPAFFFGTYTSTVVLNNPGTQNPATVGTSGFINVNSTAAYTPGILGTNSFPWTLTNNGTIQSLGSVGLGVSFTSGGTVTNAPAPSFGTAGPGPLVGGIIQGTERGVWIDGAAGSVNNSGTITQTGAPASVLIPGGVFMGFGGNVANSGTITAQSPVGNGVDLGSIGPGTVTNSGLISAGSNGVSINTGTVTNSGTVSAGVSGVKLQSGSVSNTGLITAAGLGVSFAGTVASSGTVTNTGTIQAVSGAGNSSTILFAAGGRSRRRQDPEQRRHHQCRVRRQLLGNQCRQRPGQHRQ